MAGLQTAAVPERSAILVPAYKLQRRRADANRQLRSLDYLISVSAPSASMRYDLPEYPGSGRAVADHGGEGHHYRFFISVGGPGIS
jgi:hypothetical protein